jgi:hypothetical protein
MKKIIVLTIMTLGVGLYSTSKGDGLTTFIPKIAGSMTEVKELNITSLIASGAKVYWSAQVTSFTKPQPQPKAQPQTKVCQEGVASTIWPTGQAIKQKQELETNALKPSGE